MEKVEAYTVGVTSPSPDIDTTTARLLKDCPEEKEKEGP
jgi:hypothetical protein